MRRESSAAGVTRAAIWRDRDTANSVLWHDLAASRDNSSRSRSFCRHTFGHRAVSGGREAEAGQTGTAHGRGRA
ncbi:hypothetical protein DIPPA_01106 [Diplonema papillatum]|nr:hypothetical protein DIPPA_01106 [Diplonema papillatum]